MIIKIEEFFNIEIKYLRQESYSAYDWDGVDREDLLASTNKWYINCYENDKLIGTARLIKNALPFKRYYKIETKENDFEFGRLAIANLGFGKRYSIISAIIKKVIMICTLNNCNKIYTGSPKHTKSLYEKLVGFKQLGDAAAYPPASNGIFPLALDFEKEYKDRSRGFFKYTSEELAETAKELNYDLCSITLHA